MATLPIPYTPVLYLLTRTYEEGHGSPLDQTHAVLVRAVTREQARELASGKAGDEGPDVWLDVRLSRCEVVEAEGSVGVIYAGVR